MLVKNRSGKRDFKYKRKRDNAFLGGRDARIVRYSMAGNGITVSCTRETLPQGRLLISQGTSAILSEMWMMETSTSPVVVQRRKNSSRTNRQLLATLSEEANLLLGRVSTFGRAVRFNHRLMF